MLQEYDRFPQWLIDVEEGKIWSKKHKKFIGSLNDFGYLQVPTNPSSKKVHRIIWECVNGEIPKGYDVHHIDGNKENNSIYNLELKEKGEHIREHKIGKQRSEETKKKISKNCKGKNIGQIPWNKGIYNVTNAKPVLQIDKITNKIIAEYPSAQEVERLYGYDQGHISDVCNNKPYHKTAYGYIWKYKN